MADTLGSRHRSRVGQAQAGGPVQSLGEQERKLSFRHRYRLLGRSSKHAAAGKLGLIVSKVPGLWGDWSTDQHIEAACGWAVVWTTHVDCEDSYLESVHSSPLNWV